MLSAKFKSANGMFQFDVQVANAKELFAEVGYLNELFADPHCGVCEGKNGFGITPRLRKAGDNDQYDYFEMQCLDPQCRARLSFGQSLDKTTLFPKRKTADGKGWAEHRGWERYVRQSGDQHEPEPVSQPRPRAAAAGAPASSAPAPSAPSAPMGSSEIPSGALPYLESVRGDRRQENPVYVGLCQKLRAIGGDSLANKTWNEATQDGNVTDFEVVIPALCRAILGRGGSL